MEVSSDLEVLDVAGAARSFLSPLDRRVDGSHSRIDNVVLQRGRHDEAGTLDALRLLGPRPQPAMDAAPNRRAKKSSTSLRQA